MKRISVIVFTTFLSCSVLGIAQQVGPDGRLQRAGEKTADQQAAEKAQAEKEKAEKAKAAQAAPVEKPTPAAAKPQPNAAATKPQPVQTAAKKPEPAAKPASTAKAAAEPKLINGIPEGAVLLDPYIWSYTDSTGKEWIYRRTPFGVSKIPRSDTEPAAGGGQGGVSPSSIPELKVVEAGEELQFEQNSPFGVRKWTKKKTELNSNERAAWDRLKKKD
jgi:hypothetical protein